MHTAEVKSEAQLWIPLYILEIFCITSLLINKILNDIQYARDLLFRNFRVLVNFFFCHLIFETQIFILQLKDCNVVASKLVLILDDLLWVLTDSQLKAMVQYAKSLSEAIEKSTEQRKSLASETTQVWGVF